MNENENEFDRIVAEIIDADILKYQSLDEKKGRAFLNKILRDSAKLGFVTSDIREALVKIYDHKTTGSILTKFDKLGAAGIIKDPDSLPAWSNNGYPELKV